MRLCHLCHEYTKIDRLIHYYKDFHRAEMGYGVVISSCAFFKLVFG